MKEFLQHRSRRSGYDGWALRLPEWHDPLPWTVSTTREEVRLLRLERPDLFGRVREVAPHFAPPGQDAGEASAKIKSSNSTRRNT